MGDVPPPIAFANSDPAGKDPVETEQGIQDSRLASAVWSDQTQRLSTSEAKAHVVQDSPVSIARAQIIDANKRVVADECVEPFDTDIDHLLDLSAGHVVSLLEGSRTVTCDSTLFLIGRG